MTLLEDGGCDVLALPLLELAGSVHAAESFFGHPLLLWPLLWQLLQVMAIPVLGIFPDFGISPASFLLVF